MAKLIPLFSSSKGNSIFIGEKNNGILIDAGVSCKRLTGALEIHGIQPDCISAIFVTHEHSDHINGLKVFTKKYHTPVFAQNLNLEFLAEKDYVDPSSTLYEIGQASVEYRDFRVRAFETSHDTRQSCGYRVETPDGKVCCVCTDLGYISKVVHDNLVGSDLVLLEANYDREMLKNGPYPYMLKQRINSDKGHLCNVDSAKEIHELVKSGTTHIILGHLSQENNTPNIAGNTVVRTLDDMIFKKDCMLRVAPVETRGEVAFF